VWGYAEVWGTGPLLAKENWEGCPPGQGWPQEGTRGLAPVAGADPGGVGGWEVGDRALGPARWLAGRLQRWVGVGKVRPGSREVPRPKALREASLGGLAAHGRGSSRLYPGWSPTHLGELEGQKGVPSWVQRCLLSPPAGSPHVPPCPSRRHCRWFAVEERRPRG